MVKTAHSAKRQQQRGLRDDVIEFILDFGHVEYSQGYAYYCVRERDLPSYLANSRIADTARPWVVIASECPDLVVTAYTTDSPSRWIRHLSKRRDVLKSMRRTQSARWR